MTQELLIKCHAALWAAHLVLKTMYPEQAKVVLDAYIAVNDALPFSEEPTTTKESP